jgi:hypothetical protein
MNAKTKDQSGDKGAFWTSLPGIIVALTGLLGAIGASVGVIYPMIARAGGDVNLAEFKDKTVLEKGSYKVHDGETVIALFVSDIKVRRRIVYLETGPEGQRMEEHQFGVNEPTTFVVSGKTYEVIATDLADVSLRPDTAQLTILRR